MSSLGGKHSGSHDEETDSATNKKQRKKVLSNTVKVSGVPTDISFALSDDIIAVSTYSRTIELINHVAREKVFTLDFGIESNSDNDLLCRTLDFSLDGSDRLIAAMNDCSVVLYDVEYGMKEVRKIPGVSGAPANCMTVLDENLFAIGDDCGSVYIWDERSKENEVARMDVSSESINKLFMDQDSDTLLCALAEGKLASVKVRMSKVVSTSQEYDHAFNCIGTYRQRTKVAVGDDDGHIYFFDWNKFHYHNDMFKGHKESINAMIPITDGIGVLGYEDGSIRAASFFPHKSLGVVGKHDTPIEHMDISPDGHTLATSAHGELVCFWDMDYFQYMTTSKKESRKKKRSKSAMDIAKRNLPSSNEQNSSDFFSGLNASDDEEDKD